MSIKFRKIGTIKSSDYGANFDKEKITFLRSGKAVNLYDYIQSQNQDLEVYEVLERTGSLDSMNKSTQQIYADFTNAMSLRNICDQKVEVNNIFETLPINVKRIFNNDVKNFIENGEKYFTDIIKEQKKVAEVIKKAEEKPKEEENNVQK